MGLELGELATWLSYKRIMTTDNARNNAPPVTPPTESFIPNERARLYPAMAPMVTKTKGKRNMTRVAFTIPACLLSYSTLSPILPLTGFIISISVEPRADTDSHQPYLARGITKALFPLILDIIPSLSLCMAIITTFFK